MKKLIFGLVLFFVGMSGTMSLWDNYSYGQRSLFVLVVFMAIAGFCVAFWAAFLAGPFSRWWNAEVTINVCVNAKTVAQMNCLRSDKRDELAKRAKTIEEVKAALAEKKILMQSYSRGHELDFRTKWES